jgi:hypothetical protein
MRNQTYYSEEYLRSGEHEPDGVERYGGGEVVRSTKVWVSNP